jgi:hypothetical protein
MASRSTYSLLRAFEDAFLGHRYSHRNPQVGNRIADHLFEDMYRLAISTRFHEGVDRATHVLNPKGRSPGIRARRGDGSFGDLVPGAKTKAVAGFLVPRGPTANVELGAEVKIICKAMIRQIDRVQNDLKAQAQHFKEKGPDALTVAIVAINFADHYVSWEGDREFRTSGVGRNLHPAQEAHRAEARLLDVEPSFTELIQIGFVATNEAPYSFQFVELSKLEERYGSALVRLSREYDRRF